jgi:hypothetical protein
VVEGIDDHDPGHHQERCADGNYCPPPLATHGLIDARLQHPRQHRTGERVVVEFE